jgi:hypothetical protein
MLKITSEERADGLAAYRVEGRLAGPYVKELGRLTLQPPTVSSRMALDLSGLTFVDAEGARLLRELVARNVEIYGCSSFVAHLLGLP